MKGKVLKLFVPQISLIKQPLRPNLEVDLIDKRIEKQKQREIKRIMFLLINNKKQDIMDVLVFTFYNTATYMLFDCQSRTVFFKMQYVRWPKTVDLIKAEQ